MDDWITDFILRYSYWAIVAGVMLEGDLTLLVAGMLAHDKLLGFGFWTTVSVCMAGALLGDMVSFLFGRRVRNSICDTHYYKKFHPRMEWLDLRFGVLSIVLVKYVYGLRFASSIFWGVSRMSFLRFAVLTVVSCFVWVIMLVGLGYLFGTAISAFLDRFEAVAFGLCAAGVAALLLWGLHRWWVSPTIQHGAEAAGLTQELHSHAAPLAGDKPASEEPLASESTEKRVEV